MACNAAFFVSLEAAAILREAAYACLPNSFIYFFISIGLFLNILLYDICNLFVLIPAIANSSTLN